MVKKRYKYFLVILLPLLLSGCLGTSHLKDNEKLLLRQGIQAPKSVNQDELNDLYAQRPNRRFLGLPIFHLVAIYYWGLHHYDREKYVKKKEAVEKKFDDKIAKATSQKKINNYQFRKQKKIEKLNSFIEEGNLRMQWGEPIAVFDTAMIDLTAQRFRDYLFSEGYFTNVVTPKVSTFQKFATVSYRVNPGRPYVIDSIFYDVQDSAVFAIIRNNVGETKIKKGERYRQDNLTAEQERLDGLMKDNGFYDFSRQYVEFSMDTSMLLDRRITVLVTVLDPSKRDAHKQFIIDSVKFVTDAGTNIPRIPRQMKAYRNVHYYFYKSTYNRKILGQRVFLVPGALYSRTKTVNTQRQLANLDAFKFVNINYDTSGGKFVANIFTSPLDRYEWSNEVGVNVTQGFPGPFYSLNFKKRNIFGGLENLELSGRFGFEGVASATSDQNVYKSTSAGVNATLVFPQFLWPFREKTQLWFGKYNPKTRLSIGYNYTDRPEYTRSATTISTTYTWQNKRTTSFSLSLANISIINSTLDSLFKVELQRQFGLGNYNLVNSFNPSFVSSLIFGITWNPNQYGNPNENSVFIRAQVESGGTLLNFIGTDFITRQDLQYFKYLRFNFDFRSMRKVSKWATLAYRINTGMAYSYNDNKSLPYEKFFFVGGSNSVRAWRPRRLGPGSFKPNFSTDPVADGLYSYSFEKPAEILLEGSVELRKKLVGFIDGAVFVDAGNVWTFRAQTKTDSEGNVIANGNSKFDLGTFYKEIGVGTGFGLRFDFTFLILRFDVGIKVYDPAYDAGDRFVLNRMKFFNPFAVKSADGLNYSSFREPVIYNVGIGYPF